MDSRERSAAWVDVLEHSTISAKVRFCSDDEDVSFEHFRLQDGAIDEILLADLQECLVFAHAGTFAASEDECAHIVHRTSCITLANGSGSASKAVVRLRPPPPRLSFPYGSSPPPHS